MIFLRPEAFWLLVPLALFFFFWRFKPERRGFLGISSIKTIKKLSWIKKTGKSLSKIFWLILIILAISGLALPYGKKYEDSPYEQGRIFVLCVDLSRSMFPTIARIKENSREFIKKRAEGKDLIGVTGYGGIFQQPGGRAAIFLLPSSNHQEAEAAISLLQPEMLGRFTSIGEGLWVSLIALLDEKFKDADRYYLKKSIDSYGAEKSRPEYAEIVAKRIGQTSQRNKVILLFTDGLNNRGIEPTKVLQWARQVGIKVYFIAFDPSGNTGVSEDEAVILKKELVAAVRKTGGKYYESADINDMAKFFNDVNKIEKATIHIRTKTSRLSYVRLLAGIGLLISLTLTAVECVLRRHT